MSILQAHRRFLVTSRHAADALGEWAQRISEIEVHQIRRHRASRDALVAALEAWRELARTINRHVDAAETKILGAEQEEKNA